MAINYPQWITDETPIPTGQLVRAKKLIYLYAAHKKLYLLHNGFSWWVHGARYPDIPCVVNGVEHWITDAMDAILADVLGPRYPDDPYTIAEWLGEGGLRDTWWLPRAEAVNGPRAQMRKAALQMELNWVDINGLID